MDDTQLHLHQQGKGGNIYDFFKPERELAK
jgi:hypothetical protein